MKVIGINKRNSIQYLAKNGLRFYHKQIFIKYLYSDHDLVSSIFVIKKKIGNACIRNKIKRRLKNAIHIHMQISIICMIICQKDVEYSWKNVSSIILQFNKYLKHKQDIRYKI